MPALENRRHEAFCQAMASGFSPENAYEEAGYTPGYDHAYRVLGREDVHERISELRLEGAEISGASLREAAAALVSLARKLMGEAKPTPQEAKEAREALRAAVELRVRLEQYRDKTRHERERAVASGKIYLEGERKREEEQRRKKIKAAANANPSTSRQASI